MDREEQIEQQELERLESNAGVYDDIDPISDKHLN